VPTKSGKTETGCRGKGGDWENGWVISDRPGAKKKKENEKLLSQCSLVSGQQEGGPTKQPRYLLKTGVREGGKTGDFVLYLRRKRGEKKRLED